MSTAAIQQQLCQFTANLLEQAGGVVEWPESETQGTAVVPLGVASLLGMRKESFELCTQPGGEGLLISLGSDYLELAGRVLEDKVPRVASFRVPEQYLKRGDLQDAVDRAFSWLNARVRVREAAPAVVEYDTWWLHAALRSDDCWESCLRLTINSETLAEVDLPDPLTLWSLEAATPDGPGKAEGPTTLPRAAARAARRALDAAGEFVARMDARLGRDRRRLQDYYGALLKQAGVVNRRTKHVPAPDEIAEKKRVVQLELRRKLAELDQRYAIEAVIRPVGLARTAVPALALRLDVQRKQARRTHLIHWNSLTKHFEPMVCGGCGAAIFAVGFTNDEVLPRCAHCLESRAKPR
jgi:hypothetical protein